MGSTLFSPNYFKQVENRVDPIFVAFTFAIPYPKDASVAKILYGNETITESEITAKLFDDAMGRLILDYETLIESVQRADIRKGVENSLVSKLNNAKMKVEQGLAFIENNRDTQGRNMLSSASNIIEAFIKEVNVQKEKNIFRDDAEGFVIWAQRMILRLQHQIIENLERMGEKWGRF